MADEPTWLDGLPGQKLQDNGAPVTDSKTWNFIGVAITVVDGIPTCTFTGSGDVVGPAGATNRAVALWDTGTGKLLQDSAVTITVAGSIAIPAGETVDGRDVSLDGTALDAHVASVANPHAVTAAQAGAAPSTHVGAGGAAHANVVPSGAAGFMTGTDKAKEDQYPAPVAKGDMLSAGAGGGAFEITSVGPDGEVWTASAAESGGAGWAAPAPGASTVVSATGDTTTMSGVDVLVASMTQTPGAGTYIVIFSGSMQNSSASNTTETNVYSNGVLVADSERRHDGNSASAFTCFAKVTVGAGQAIEGRWRVSAGTGTMHERQLIVIAAA